MDFPLKWSLLCEGCSGEGEGEPLGGGTAADRQEKRDEYGRQCKTERERNKVENKRKTYKGREAWMGHIYTNARGKKGGKSMAISQHSAQPQSLDW